MDLGSEKLFAAEKDQRRIAVEVKSFIRPSPVQDLENALGQYVLYRSLLEESTNNQDRRLYLAIREAIYLDFFPEKIAQIAMRRSQLKLLIFDPKTEEIVQWIE